MTEKVIYTGYFVRDPNELLAHIPPRLDGEDVTTHAHHVTRAFMPEDGTQSITVGKIRVLRAVGEVATDQVHAVLVESPDGDSISSNEHPHLTIATAKGVSPVTSNGAIEAAVRDGTVMPIEPPIEFEATEGYFNGKHPVINQ